LTFRLGFALVVAVLYLVAGIFQFIGLGVVYNLDKKTLATMQAELAERRERAEKMSDARKTLYN
jgi:Na+/melibiose symporter-like transporter